MSYKYYKTSCERLNKSDSSNISRKVSRVNIKRVVISKKLGTCSEKSCSTGTIMNVPSAKPRKTTKSDVSFSTKFTRTSLDYCKKCGDTTTHANLFGLNSDNDQNGKLKCIYHKSDLQMAIKNQKMVAERNKLAMSKSVPLKQYYKNENFLSTDSIQETGNNFKKMSLDTINELPEIRTNSDNIKTKVEEVNVFEIYSDSEEAGFLDIDDADNIDNLKKFRNENYFETHSVKSRVEDRGNISVTGLKNHKCVYRFYLNERLFPVPLSTDHHDNVRCVECHLPMDLNIDTQSNISNGTIQAKVKLGCEKEVQDLILFLPVKDSLIIKERRKQIREDDEVVYFGVVKLDSFGNSVFKSTLPADSLALKYQKGYREYGNSDTYKYKGIEEDDIIIV